MRFGQLVGFFALVVSLYILWQIKQILLLVFAAVVLATVLNQIVEFFHRNRIKRGIAIAITLVLVLAVIVGFFVLIVPRLVDQLQQFSDYLPQALSRMERWNNWLTRVVPQDVLQEIRGLSYLTNSLQAWLSGLVRNFFRIITNSLGIAVTLFLFVALTVMLLSDPSSYRQGFILLFPAFYRRRVDEILQECEHSLVGWIKGTLLTMLIIATLSYIGLLILGVPLPLVNALLAGLLEFIPNIGPTLSVIPPALLALIDAPWKAGAVVALYFGIQQVESLIVVPIVMKSQVDILPAVTLLAVIIFGSFFGFLGVFLAVPLVIVLQVWIKEVVVKDIFNNWKDNRNKKDEREQDAENLENGQTAVIIEEG